ncbi:hypothetical protein ACHAW6_003795 [Cyclotella cf. meneghiniana]
MNLHWFELDNTSMAPMMRVSSCLPLLICMLIVIQMLTLLVSMGTFTTHLDCGHFY